MPTEKFLIQKEVKALIYTGSGLNDTFSLLAKHIEFFKQNSEVGSAWKLENLHLGHPFYEPLDNYFNFKEIKYVKNPEENYYSFVSTFCSGGGTYTANKDLFNYVFIKPEIIASVPDYSNHIGVHFRCMAEECTNNENKMQEERNRYLQIFRDIYNANEKYLIVTDSGYLTKIREQYPNITLIAPEAGTLLSHHLTRRNNVKGAVEGICALGKCKRIYTTKGNYTKLTAFINKDLDIKTCN